MKRGLIVFFLTLPIPVWTTIALDNGWHVVTVSLWFVLIGSTLFCLLAAFVIYRFPYKQQRLLNKQL